MSSTFSAATAKEAGQTSGASTSTGTFLLLTTITLESGWPSRRATQTHRRSEVAAVGRIQGPQGEAADMDQVGLDSFAGAAGGNTHPALAAGLKHHLRQSS